nr:WPP domain-interacting tail-anchored protein 1 [Tanacetum cinerariifolium]
MVTTASYDASSRTSSLHSIGTSSISIKTSRDSESTGEIIARFELDIAFICERLTNLNLLSMHIETRERDFEPFMSDMDPNLVVKALEYDLLVGLANEKARTRVEMEKENTTQELKDSNEKVVSLEKQLSDTNVKLQNAKAYYEACLEDKSMLHFTIKDMENVIKDLKSKVTRAEGQTDSMEDKCIILSDVNDDLKKELSFVKGRFRCLETSLHQMEEAKKASARDISIRSKFITDLVMKMAHQRERLQQQVFNTYLMECISVG